MKTDSSTFRIALPAASGATRILLAVVLLLVSLSVAGQVAKHFWGHPQLKGFVPLFYLDYESNVPTWYSSCALALAGMLLLTVACVKFARREPFRFHWAVLAALFFLLSVDEVAMLHEYPIDPLRAALGAGGLLYYTWVLPGIAVVAAVALAYARFLQHLPATTRWGFLLAGAVFVGGAIGVEMLSGLVADHAGEGNFTYAMVITLEETLEMLGVVLLIHTLLDYLANQVGEIHVRLSPGAPRETVSAA